MLEDSVGYVRLKVFLENKDALRDSASLVRVRLEELAHAGARSFVFDLRATLAEVVLKVFSIFSEGEPVLLFRDRNGKDEVWHREGQTGTHPCRLFSLWIAEPSSPVSQPMPFSNTSPP